MTDWTPDALAAEAERRTAYEATGNCPDSGYTISHCWTIDLCDCSMAPPARCNVCGVKVWDIDYHSRRMHPA
jgi:hypothetical protein